MQTSTTHTRLAQNLEGLRSRIEAARSRSDVATAEVRLVVVTKSAPPHLFGPLADVGVTDVGENRVQAAVARRPLAPPSLVWHGIGHLQRNKARDAVGIFDVFHALDSRRLAERLDQVVKGTPDGGRRERRWPVYLQVNAASDPDKGGVVPEEALSFVKDLAAMPHLSCRGLMTMGRLGADEAETREAFRTLRLLRDDLVSAGVGAVPPAELSMGMSGDFEWAVEEGATIVRIGSAVFEGVEPSTPATMEDPS